MLNEEVAKYRELSGDTNPNTPISRIGGYLDGYEKALEQEPNYNSIKTELNGDTIRRQAVLDEAFEVDTKEYGRIEVVGVDAINSLPPVTPQPKWIPVSERLPKRSGNYLVSVIDGSGEDNDYEEVGVAWFAHKKDYGIKESEWRELGIDETVIAWMPLPKPYEPQESEE